MPKGKPNHLLLLYLFPRL